MMPIQIASIETCCNIIIFLAIVEPVSLAVRFRDLPDIGINYFRDVSLVSSEVSSPHRRRTKRSEGEECSLLSIPIGGVIRDFCVREQLLEAGVGIVAEDAEFDLGGVVTSAGDSGVKVATGYDTGRPQESGLNGYISGGQFFGKLHHGGVSYYVEPFARFHNEMNTSSTAAEKQAVMYEDVLTSASVWNFSVGSLELSDGSQGNPYNITGRLCPMLLHADHRFVAESGGHQQAAARMTLIAAEADAVLRNADWNGDGLPDNVGISLRYLVTTAATKRRPQKFSPVDSRDYLVVFAATEPLLASVCMGAAFTRSLFLGRVLGVSFTSPPGGVCTGDLLLASPRVALNALAVTSLSARGAVPAAVQALALAHELGHSLGAPHDGDRRAGAAACEPGRFLMSPLSVNGSSRDHFHFSPCSRRSVQRAMRRRWPCLEPATRPYCGNGLVEGLEECDCGLAVDCHVSDRCCVARGATNASCMVNRGRGFVCHPSLGPCCGSNCQFANLSHLGIDCSLLTRLVDAPCPCADCRCGVMGRCVGSSCQGEECAALQLKECVCPSTNGSCGSCCRVAGGDCLPAGEATELLIRDGNITLQQLQESVMGLPAPPGPTTTRVVCQGDSCLPLRFRHWPLGGPCTFRGTVSVCSLQGCQRRQLHRMLDMDLQHDCAPTGTAKNNFVYLLLSLLMVLYQK